MHTVISCKKRCKNCIKNIISLTGVDTDNIHDSIHKTLKQFNTSEYILKEEMNGFIKYIHVYFIAHATSNANNLGKSDKVQIEFIMVIQRIIKILTRHHINLHHVPLKT